jgi:hypothetical protein
MRCGFVAGAAGSDAFPARARKGHQCCSADPAEIPMRLSTGLQGGVNPTWRGSYRGPGALRERLRPRLPIALDGHEFLAGAAAGGDAGGHHPGDLVALDLTE